MNYTLEEKELLKSLFGKVILVEDYVLNDDYKFILQSKEEETKETIINIDKEINILNEEKRNLNELIICSDFQEIANIQSLQKNIQEIISNLKYLEDKKKILLKKQSLIENILKQFEEQFSKEIKKYNLTSSNEDYASYLQSIKPTKEEKEYFVNCLKHQILDLLYKKTLNSKDVYVRDIDNLFEKLRISTGLDCDSRELNTAIKELLTLRLINIKDSLERKIILGKNFMQYYLDLTDDEYGTLVYTIYNLPIVDEEIDIFNKLCYINHSYDYVIKPTGTNRILEQYDKKIPAENVYFLSKEDINIIIENLVKMLDAVKKIDKKYLRCAIDMCYNYLRNLNIYIPKKLTISDYEEIEMELYRDSRVAKLSSSEEDYAYVLNMTRH